MRTGMEAVYTLLKIDRGVPEVWGSVYDIRDLLNATVKLTRRQEDHGHASGLEGENGPEGSP